MTSDTTVRWRHATMRPLLIGLLVLLCSAWPAGAIPQLRVNGSSSAVVATAPATVSVSVTNGPGNWLDYIGLFPVNAPTGPELDYLYLTGSKYLGAGYVNATVTFVLPAPGAYEFRLVSGNVVVATSPVVTTTAAPETLPCPAASAEIVPVTLVPNSGEVSIQIPGPPLAPCETLSVAVDAEVTPVGIYHSASLAVSVYGPSIGGAAPGLLFARSQTCNETCAMWSPAGQDTNGSPYVVTRGPAGWPTDIRLSASAPYSTQYVDALVRLIRAPRADYNTEGSTFANAPFRSLFPRPWKANVFHREAGQFMRLRLLPGGTVRVTGTATRVHPTWEGYFRVTVYNEVGVERAGLVAVPVGAGSPSTVTIQSGTFTNTSSRAEDFFLGLSGLYMIQDIQLDVHATLYTKNRGQWPPSTSCWQIGGWCSSPFLPGVDTVTYYDTDAVGSVRMLTDASGAVVGRYDYTPFGALSISETPTSAPTDRRTYAGKERDPETALDYFGARYYASQTGRFTTVDPVVPIEDSLLDPQRWNRYTYVMNRPLALTDPDGRCPSCVMLAQRLALQAAQLASRYGTQAYNWATRFFNSPTGQEVTATAAELITGGQLPYGFSNAAQLQSFGTALGSGLRDVGGDAARAFLTGSAVTGKSFATGAAFDVGRTSDFDVALVGGSLLNKAKELGLELRGKGSRTGPLRPEDLKALGLDKLSQRLSQMAGRPVNFMIFESEEALRARGAGYVPF